MNCLILGDGQLATELIKQTNWPNISRKGQFVDINDSETYIEYLEDDQFDTIINCIAYTNTMHNSKDLHWNTNYTSVMDLVDICNVYNKKLVHISTDYIYANSRSIASEEDIPIHQNTWYSYCKLLSDAYVQARSLDYLLIRTSFRPKPFPFIKAWLDHMTNADYTDVIVSKIVQLIENKSQGVFNVGTEIKTLHQLAQQTRPDCIPILDNNSFIRPKDVTMSTRKFDDEFKQ